jgi:hypothetical protein
LPSNHTKIMFCGIVDSNVCDQMRSEAPVCCILISFAYLKGREQLGEETRFLESAASAWQELSYGRVDFGSLQQSIEAVRVNVRFDARS